jgi:hypothetical protein
MIFRPGLPTCDCSRHTADRAPERFPTAQSAARWGARISGTLHDRPNVSSTNYDAAAVPGPLKRCEGGLAPPTRHEGGWAIRWLSRHYVRTSAPLLFPEKIEQSGRREIIPKLSDACPKAGRRHNNAGWLSSGTSSKYTRFFTEGVNFDIRGPHHSYPSVLCDWRHGGRVQLPRGAGRQRPGGPH